MNNQAFTERQLEMIITAFGSSINELLEDPAIIEIMLNPDGKLWAESLKKGKFFTHIHIPFEQSFNIIKLIASFSHAVVDDAHPELSAELPHFQARFQAWIPPISKHPTFTIRKKATHVFTLADYIKRNQITLSEAQQLQQAIRDRKNILIAGGTGSGKTTFANALLSELKDYPDRVLILEDLPELQISSQDCVHLKTNLNLPMQALVKGSLRMRPDRIIIGEVRDGSALDLLKAWNTGHPGGICTIHANGAKAALMRLEDLIQEAIPIVPQRLIEQAIDVIVFMKRDSQVGYKVAEIIEKQ